MIQRSIYGTRVYVDGRLVPEVIRVTVGKTINIEGNWVPSIESHAHIITAIQNDKPVEVRIVFPQDAEMRYTAVILSGKGDFLYDKEATLHFSFPAPVMPA